MVIHNSVNIDFTLNRTLPVKLSAFNSLGREVKTIYEGTLPAGNHLQVWNAADMSSGIYTIILQSGGVRQSMEAVLLK